MSDVYLLQATLTITKAVYIRGMEKQDLGFELKASCVNNSGGINVGPHIFPIC